MRYRALISIMLLGASCASVQPVYDQYDLMHQILRPMGGHDGRLVNRACSRRGGDRQCEEWKTTEYDISDSAVRARLIAAEFDCVAGGRLFQVCENTAGLCHQTVTREGCVLGIFGCKRVARSEILYVRDYQRLIDLGVECASGKVYDVLQFNKSGG